jgi:hypothetical protein
MDKGSNNSEQMEQDMTGQIREHMMVHAQGQGSMNGVEGEHVGTVDYVEGDNIILTKNDSPDGMHHSISVDFIDRVEGNTVFLNVDAETIQQAWGTVEASDRDNNRKSMSDMNR